jgi:putative ABC transport system permease protein
MIARLALRSVRARAGTHLASAMVLAAGTALLTGFASLFETGLAMHDGNRGILVLMPAILGGWSVAIVVFGTVSTISLAVRQREREMALLRAVAATPRQVQTMIVAESLLVAVPVVLVGLLPGLLFGWFLLARLTATGAITGLVPLQAGGLAIAIGAGVSLLAATAGAGVAGRKAAAVPPVRALAAAAEAPLSGPLLPRARLVTGLVVTGIGLGMGVTTLFMANGPLLSSIAGPAGVATAVGLALLARAPVALVGRTLSVLPGAVGRLAGRNLRVRARAHATAVGPLVLLVGIGGGTLAMQAIEDGLPAAPGPQLAPVNYLVVVVIVGFAAVAVANTLLTATRGRTAEFATLRLTGATRRQVLAVGAIEALLTTAVAAVLGAVAALITVVPFMLVRGGATEVAMPGWPFPTVVLGALAIALTATLPTAARMLRP